MTVLKATLAGCALVALSALSASASPLTPTVFNVSGVLQSGTLSGQLYIDTSDTSFTTPNKAVLYENLVADGDRYGNMIYVTYPGEGNPSYTLVQADSLKENALGEAVSGITLLLPVSSFVGYTGGPLYDALLFEHSLEIDSLIEGSITPAESPVPEPATLGLLLTGVGCVTGWRSWTARRRGHDSR